MSDTSRFVSDKTLIQNHIKAIKALHRADYSRFVPGYTYLINDSNDVFFIAEIAPHPIDRLPTAYGHRVTVDGYTSEYIYLHQLGNRFN